MRVGKVKQQEFLLYERVKETGKLTLSQAIELLGVSESTVRRFFSSLEAAGRVVRIHGGIALVSAGALDAYSFDRSKNRNTAQKQIIAAQAVSMVENHDTIYIDSGTTLTYFSERLSEQLAAKALTDITVVTNSLSNLNILHEHSRLLLVGGEFREQRRDFCGYLAEETLKSLRFTKCFLGSDGYNAGFGFTTTDFTTARLNEIVLDNSARSFILMDASKFHTPAAVSYSRSHAVSALITDSPPPHAVMEEFTRQGMAVELAAARA